MIEGAGNRRRANHRLWDTPVVTPYSTRMNSTSCDLDFSPRNLTIDVHEPAHANAAANAAWRLKLLLPVLALAALTAIPCMAQTNSWPDDLVSIATNDVPTVVYAYWSLANWNQWGPCPDDCAPGYPLYYSPSDPNTNRVIYIDDRESGGSHADDDPSLPPGISGDSGDGEGDSGGDTPSPLSFGTNLCLFLSHPDSNWNAILTISNTVTGTPYEIIVSPIVTNALPTWVSAGVWPGAAGNTTPITVELPTNTAYFFDARIWTLSEFLTRPNDGQLLLLPSSTNAIQAMINGASNTYVPFASGGSNYVLLDQTPLYSVNLGYDASDSGPSNATTYATWTNQGIRGVIGFSATLTNFCLSYNPLTNLDVHGFTALQDLECWHCTNLLAANVTNCPSLERVCLEACDLHGTLYLSGDTNLQQLRAAFQGNYDVLQEIVFGGAGPNIWHLCAHDNGFINNFNFTQFPNLNQFWFWQAGQSGPLILNATNSSTNLTSVQVYNEGQNSYPNAFTTADFHGQLNLNNVLIYGIPTLTNLNVSGCPNLIDLEAEGDALATGVPDAILASLAAYGLSGGSAFLTNSAPLSSPAGYTALYQLQSRDWWVTLTPPPTGTPQITNVVSVASSNTATITWDTDIQSDSSVCYGTTTSYSSSTNLSSPTTNHSVILSGLTTNTLYHFYVASATNGLTGITWDYEFTTTGPPNTNAITFVTTSQTNTMQANVTGTANYVWQWADGWTDTNNPAPTHRFSSPGSHINTLVVSSAGALTVFGVGCQSSASTTLSSVSGLTNYPNLQDLYFYLTGITNVSLAGCSNLTHIALAGANVSSNEEDSWFNDLAAAQAAGKPPGISAVCDGDYNYFFYPSSPGPTSGSYSNRLFLSGIGWFLNPVP
jgi:hypothetical protein